MKWWCCYHRRRQSIAIIDCLDDCLVRTVPIWPLSIWHHFPHNDAITPHVRRWRELPVNNSFRCRPSYRNFTSLQIQQTFYRHSKRYISLQRQLVLFDQRTAWRRLEAILSEIGIGFFLPIMKTQELITPLLTLQFYYRIFCLKQPCSWLCTSKLSFAVGRQ